MEDMNISLPSSQQAYVEDQVASGNYPSVSEFVAELIHADQRAKAQAKLEDLLLEGLASEEIPWSPEVMEDIRREAREGL
jgi:antitoxin ParD1/3/4